VLWDLREGGFFKNNFTGAVQKTDQALEWVHTLGGLHEQ
jgi:hypothetical protein